jgi:chromosome segregation ATPase
VIPDNHRFDIFFKFPARSLLPVREFFTTDAAMLLLGRFVLNFVLYTTKGSTMKKSLKIAAGSVLGLGLLFWVAGRSLGELAGYFRASADETVSQLEDQIPDEVHDRKLAHELTSVRKEVIERQVQLSQSKTQIAQLRDDVSKLEITLAARKRLLSEAFPILQAAEEQQLQQVRFANADYQLVDFQREIDDLMASQDSETKQLAIKKSGLTRLEKSEKEAESALVDMRHALDGAEHEVAVLKSRREQAEVESKTLDMVTAVSDGVHTTTEGVGRSLDRLRENVTRKEAVNEAKRGLAPVNSRASTNQLARQWNRLEALRKYQEESDSAPKVQSPIQAESIQAESSQADSSQQID